MDRRLKDLDDVDKALRENTVEEIIARKTKHRRQIAARRRRKSQMQAESGILVIPAIIVVLMILIVIMDHAGAGHKGRTPETAAPLQGSMEATASDLMETSAGNVDSTEETQDPTIVREYNDNVLEDFFKRYFAAKLSADVDTIYKMSGVTNKTDAEKEQFRQQLKTQAGYIESYDNIKLYAVNGLEKNSKLVFITYDVNFRRASQPAPAIMYCYIKVNDQNEFELVENMTPEQVKFINSYTTGHQEVIELINATNSRLLEALSSDSRLAVIYDAFQTGRIYSEDQSVIDSEVSLISVETEAETTASESKDASASGNRSGSDGDTEQKETSAKSTSRRTETTAAETKSAGASSKGTSGTTSAAENSHDVVEAGGDPHVTEAPTASSAAQAAAGPGGGNADSGSNSNGNSGAPSGDVVEVGQGPEG